MVRGKGNHFQIFKHTGQLTEMMEQYIMECSAEHLMNDIQTYLIGVENPGDDDNENNDDVKTHDRSIDAIENDTPEPHQEYTIKNGQIIYDSIPEPKTYTEAITGKYAKFWLAAIKYELGKLAELKTFETVKNEGQPLLDAKWVFKVKYHPHNNKIRKFRARLVTRGFKSHYNQDYKYTHSPVSQITTLRTCMAIAFSNNMKSRLIDFDSAYLHPEITAPVFMNRQKPCMFHLITYSELGKDSTA